MIDILKRIIKINFHSGLFFYSTMHSLILCVAIFHFLVICFSYLFLIITVEVNGIMMFGIAFGCLKYRTQFSHISRKNASGNIFRVTTPLSICQYSNRKIGQTREYCTESTFSVFPLFQFFHLIINFHYKT